MSPGGHEGTSIAFAERYLLARFNSGGVIIDLESGNCYRINQTAAFICDALLRAPDRNAAVASVAQHLRIDAQEAKQVADEVISGLDVPPIRGEIQGSYRFDATDAGYELWHGDQRVLQVSADGTRVQIAKGAPPAALPHLELYVRSLAPKLLFQNQISVLHASCCMMNGNLTAFAGVSGAGKTTTAHAFAAAGATLISEDLVVLAPECASPLVLTEGEKQVHDWASAIARQLASDPATPIPTAALSRNAIKGPTIPLHSISFMDVSRREGLDFRSERQDEPDALAELLRHDFLGANAGSWRRFFETAVALLGRIEARTMWSPAGTDGLTAAAARYISRTAS